MRVVACSITANLSSNATRCSLVSDSFDCLLGYPGRPLTVAQHTRVPQVFSGKWKGKPVAISKIKAKDGPVSQAQVLYRSHSEYGSPSRTF